MLRSAITLCGGVALSVVIAQSGGAQRATAAGDWPMYRHDLAGTGYSPLARINTTNVATLTRLWTYSLQSDATPPPVPGAGRGGPNSEATPIVVAGVMYFPAANRIVALSRVGKQVLQGRRETGRQPCSLYRECFVPATRWQNCGEHQTPESERNA